VIEDSINDELLIAYRTSSEQYSFPKCLEVKGHSTPSPQESIFTTTGVSSNARSVTHSLHPVLYHFCIRQETLAASSKKSYLQPGFHDACMQGVIVPN